MRATFLSLLLALAILPALRAQDNTETVLVTGGPSLYQWEKYKAVPHDKFWGNFVRATRVRIEQLRQQYGPGAHITWLVYKRAYDRRSQQDHQDLISDIVSVRNKYGVNLIWISSGQDVIDYLNNGQPRDQVKLADFEYFGHSNSRCFMFDYSNEIDSASKACLHQDDLKQIHKGLFISRPFIKSWGCYTGESMSGYWRRATGKKMIGAVGKTDYSGGEATSYLPVVNGRWGG